VQGTADTLFLIHDFFKHEVLVLTFLRVCHFPINGDQDFKVLHTYSGNYKEYEKYLLGNKSKIGIILGARGTGKTAIGIKILENIPKNTNWIGNFTIGSDLNGSNNYQYFFMMANIKYNF
jgi:hypothetical protein